MALTTRPRRRINGSQLVKTIVVYASALVIFIVTLFPFYWMVTASFKPFMDIFRGSALIPRTLVWDHYKLLFEQTAIIRHLQNSLWTATAATAITLVLAGMMAYTITRYEVVAGEFMAQFTLFTYMVPSIILLIPFYIALRTVGLTDSHFGLIIAYLTLTLPYSIWSLRSYFATIPKHMEEAALVDGANQFQSFWFVVIPQAMPGIVATAIFVFIVCWGEFLFPTILLTSDDLKTVPVTLANLVGGGQNIDFGLLMAGSTVTTIPILLIFLFLQRYLVAGFAAGGFE